MKKIITLKNETILVISLFLSIMVITGGLHTYKTSVSNYTNVGDYKITHEFYSNQAAKISLDVVLTNASPEIKKWAVHPCYGPVSLSVTDGYEAIKFESVEGGVGICPFDNAKRTYELQSGESFTKKMIIDIRLKATNDLYEGPVEFKIESDNVTISLIGNIKNGKLILTKKSINGTKEGTNDE